MSIPVTFGTETFHLTAEQVEKMKKALGLDGKKLSEIAIGETFKIADMEFIKFTEENGVAQIVAKNILFNAKFDDGSNNFSKSSLLKKLNKEVLQKVENAVGSDNVVEFETDLTSLDGLDDYGVMKSKISLPTFDFYRKHVKIFDKYNPGKWWWLSTPDSTPTHGTHCAVRCVDGVGALDGSGCSHDCGVRPFLTLKSNIFVSC